MRVAPLFALPLALVAVPHSSAQSPTVVVVRLSNFDFAPRTIVLDRQRSYALRLHNSSDGGHDFTARQFFAAATIAADDRRWIRDGSVEVPAGQVREIRLATSARPGSYKLKCTHRFHKLFGMTGTIVVR